MRTGAIIGSALAGAVVGAIATLDRAERRQINNYLSDLWDKVPSPKEVIPRNVQLEAKKLSISRKPKFANAGRVGDVKARGRGRRSK